MKKNCAPPNEATMCLENIQDDQIPNSTHQTKNVEGVVPIPLIKQIHKLASCLTPLLFDTTIHVVCCFHFLYPMCFLH